MKACFIDEAQMNIKFEATSFLLYHKRPDTSLYVLQIVNLYYGMTFHNFQLYIPFSTTRKPYYLKKLQWNETHR